MPLIRIAALSLQGRRPTNQDRVFVTAVDAQQDRVVAAVADGLGGMQAGDKAAEIAVQTLEEAAEEMMNSMSGEFSGACDAILNVFQRSNDRIRAYARAHGQVGLVGTTLVTLVVRGERFLVANAGDSRCYVIDHSAARQITHDHTVADTLLEQGALAPGDYASSPLRNQLTRSLGPKPQCDPDIFPRLEFGRISADCTFLLCSDGFYSKLTAADLKALAGADDLDQILSGLADASLERDSTDNLSAVAVLVTEVARS